MLGSIGNEVKYRLILFKTLRIRIILKITLAQLIFFFFFLAWVSTHFYVVCHKNGLMYFSPDHTAETAL